MKVTAIGLYCDDITFCQERCDWLSCPRNSKNILDKTVPHSFSVEIPDDCPKNGKAVKRMPSKEKVVKGLECCSLMNGHACSKCPYSYECVAFETEYQTGTSHLAADALSLLKESKWISVKDRLPNCNGCYIVWRPHFYPDLGMPSICYFDGQNTWHDSYGVDFTRTLASDDVSHWMPLPEQPCKAVNGE